MSLEAGRFRIDFSAMGLASEIAVANFTEAHIRVFNVDPGWIKIDHPAFLQFVVAWGGVVDPELYRSVNPSIVLEEV